MAAAVKNRLGNLEKQTVRIVRSSFAQTVSMKCLCQCVEKSDGKTHAWWDWKQRCTLNYEFQAEKKCKETEAKLGQSKRKSPRSSHYSKVRDKKPEVEKALREHLQAVQHTRPSACVNLIVTVIVKVSLCVPQDCQLESGHAQQTVVMGLLIVASIRHQAAQAHVQQ
ncbi:hypothetical protein Pelo_9592 [Pelomyxa schiedti]|nr:hypothetical protein Pelo_9592 [Pelomyxa schiedti]